MQNQDKPAGIVRAVAGIDAAITARHHIAVREFFDDGTEHLSRFTVDPTLAGLERLSQRLAAVPAPLTAVVEPTSMTWLALALAVQRAGGQMEMTGARHSSRLRGAIMGKNKSDVIDSEVLTHAGRSSTRRPWSWHPRPSWRCAAPWSAGPGPSLTATGTGGGCCRWHGGPFPMCGPRSPDPSPQPSRCWAGGPTSVPWHRRARPR